MAEYNEVIKQFKRMCWYYSRDKEQKSCPICASYPNCNIGQCRKIAFEQPSRFEDIVITWSAEHKETAYPTWYEYLTDMYPAAWNIIKDKPIPSDIAISLGIEPKEAR